MHAQPKPRRPWQRRAVRLVVRRVLFALLGAGVGLACKYLPEPMHVVCVPATEFIKLLLGG